MLEVRDDKAHSDSDNEYLEYVCMYDVGKWMVYDNVHFHATHSDWLGNVFMYLQTGTDAVSEVCREMGLEDDDDIAEYGIFTYLEDREFLPFFLVNNSIMIFKR